MKLKGFKVGDDVKTLKGRGFNYTSGKYVMVREDMDAEIIRKRGNFLLIKLKRYNVYLEVHKDNVYVSGRLVH